MIVTLSESRSLESPIPMHANFGSIALADYEFVASFSSKQFAEDAGPSSSQRRNVSPSHYIAHKYLALPPELQQVAQI